MVSGKSKLKITCADMTTLINRITEKGIVLFKINYLDEITAEITLNTKDLDTLCLYLKKSGVEYSVINRNGISVVLHKIAHRPVLCALFAIIIALNLILPGKVLFVRVEGNQKVPTNEILESAASCGITFGASTAKIRSEKMKNALLSQMDDLQWAAINTKGCVAIITVREKDEIQDAELSVGQGSSIVASRDGVLLEITTTAGQAQCTPGQAVQAGQVLISGHVNCGKILKITDADGEVYALTRHDLQILAPMDYETRTGETKRIVNYSLRIGKKLINLSENGGIYPGSCVKIYTENQLTLSDNNPLPVTLIKETVVYYDTAVPTATDSHTHEVATQYAKSYLQTQMVAGAVKNQEFSFTCSQFACKMDVSYICEEMIGRTVYHKK